MLQHVQKVTNLTRQMTLRNCCLHMIRAISYVRSDMDENPDTENHLVAGSQQVCNREGSKRNSKANYAAAKRETKKEEFNDRYSQ